MMVVHERLASLERIIEEAKHIPFTTKVSVDKEEVNALLNEIKLALPDELKQAKWISEERQKIILEAHMEAEGIIAEATSRVEEHEITRMAREKAEKLVETAKKEADQVRMASREYADTLLGNIQDELTRMTDTINRNREELK
ncbi:MAG: ATPase [Clostridia bacterium]